MWSRLMFLVIALYSVFTTSHWDLDFSCLRQANYGGNVKNCSVLRENRGS